jgi:hypothetical protein
MKESLLRCWPVSVEEVMSIELHGWRGSLVRCFISFRHRRNLFSGMYLVTGRWPRRRGTIINMYLAPGLRGHLAR